MLRTAARCFDRGVPGIVHYSREKNFLRILWAEAGRSQDLPGGIIIYGSPFRRPYRSQAEPALEHLGDSIDNSGGQVPAQPNIIILQVVRSFVNIASFWDDVHGFSGILSLQQLVFQE